MHTRNTMHSWAIASAVAAMLAAAAPSAFAQVADTPSGPATTPTATPPGPTSTTPDNSNTTTPSATSAPAPDASAPAAPSTSGSTASAPMASSDSVAAAAVPPGFPTDYSILNNRIFDNVDLEQSRARGLSENSIATIVKISRLTGVPFQQLSGAVVRGMTFPEMATLYNLKISDIYENSKETQQVADYTTLYKAAESLGKSSSMTAMPMSSPSAPMTPPSSTPSTDTPSSTPASSSSATLDIVDTASAAKNLTTLVKALQIAGLVETLKGTGPFTVFAPTDKAFAKLPAGALDALEADPAKLKTVLTYHVIPAAITSTDAASLATPTSPPTVEGSTLQITKGKRGRLKINNANIVKADIQASNGVIHIIDAVLLPPDASAPAAPTPDATTPPAAPAPAPMDATPPAAPAAPGTMTPAAPDATAPAAPAPAAPTPDATAPAAPAAPAPTDATPPAAPAAPAPDATTPPATPATPAAPGTPGQ